MRSGRYDAGNMVSIELQEVKGSLVKTKASIYEDHEPREEQVKHEADCRIMRRGNYYL